MDTKLIIKYKPENLPQKYGETISFNLDELFMVCLSEYDIDIIGQLALVTKK